MWLLIMSYYFYMSWNVAYGILLLSCTFITYIASLIIEKYKNWGDVNSKEKQVFILALGIIFSILFYYKYFNFFITNLNYILSRAGITLSTFDIVLPVGISFFTFQAAGYLIDVYRGDIYAEKNFLRYALFVSFFPN